MIAIQNGTILWNGMLLVFILWSSRKQLRFRHIQQAGLKTKEPLLCCIKVVAQFLIRKRICLQIPTIHFRRVMLIREQYV